MAVQNTLTFLLDPPRRPGLADLRDGTKTNRTSTVPPHMPNGPEFNQDGKMLAALGAMMPLALISVEFSGGAPVIASLVTARGDLAGGDLTPTDNGAGDTSITWPADTFPSPVCKPIATCNGSTADVGIAADTISNGIRVKTASGGGAADVPFTVMVF